MDGDTRKAIAVGKMLHQLSLLDEGKSVEDFLSQRVDTVMTGTNVLITAISSQFEVSKPMPIAKAVMYTMLLLGISDTFFLTQQDSSDAIIKAHALKARDLINKEIIRTASPVVLSFFKWDLNRRIWKHSKDEFRLLYLEKVAHELKKELSGNSSDIVSKYISLFIDYIIYQIDTYLLPNVPPEYEKELPQIYAFRNLLDGSTSKNVANEVFDEEDETDLIGIYKHAANHYLQGLFKSNSRFDFMFYAFIEAQNDYLKIISAIIKTLNSSGEHEIIVALNNADVPSFIVSMNSLFATVPHQLIKNTNEAYYHIFLHLTLKLIGAQMSSEVSMNTGRIDAVVEVDNFIYLIELKLNNASNAINQIHDKKYYEAYRVAQKPVKLLGLSFDSSTQSMSSNYHLDNIPIPHYS